MNKELRNKHFVHKPIFWVIFSLVFIVSMTAPFMGAIYLVYRLASTLKVGRSQIQSYFVSFLLLLIGNAFVYELFSVLHLYPNPKIIIGIYLLSSVLLRTQTKYTKPVYIRSDIACLLAAGCAVLFLIAPVFLNRHAPAAYAGSTLHLISTGEDNASHFALFKYSYQHNGYAYSSHVYTQGLIASLVNYPQGSEFTISWLAKLVAGTKYAHNNYVLVELYYAFTVSFYALLVFSCCLLATELYSLINKGSRLKPAQLLLLVLLSLPLLTFGPLLALMARGFQSEIYAYLYLTALLWVLLLADSEKFARKILLTAACFWGAICLGWWFLTPIASVPYLYFIYKNRDAINLNTIVLGTIIFIFSVYPIVLSLLSPVSSAGVNSPGGVDPISVRLAIFYAFSSLFILAIAARSKKKLLLFFLVSWLVFTLIVGAYQYLTLHYLSYFFYKSVYTLVPIGAALWLYGSIKLIEKLPKKIMLANTYFLCALIIVAAVGAWEITKPVYPRVYFNDWFNNPVSRTDLASILQTSTDKQYKDMVSIGGCIPAATYIENRWEGALFLSETPYRSNLSLATLSGSEKTVAFSLQDLSNHSSSKPLVLVGYGCGSASLMQTITTNSLTFKVSSP